MAVPPIRPGETKEQYLQRLRTLKAIDDLQRFRWYCALPGCDGKPHPNDPVDPHPYRHARANQHPSASYVTAWIQGRGGGKTRSGVEAIKHRLLKYPNHRAAIVCPTFSAARDVVIEGESGLLACLPASYKVRWNRSTGEMFLPNKSRLKIFGADKASDAEALRGMNTHTLYFDEIATMRHAQLAWDMAAFGNRLKNPAPKVFVATTPKPTKLIKWLLASPECTVVQGTIYDNADNLSPTQLAMLTEQYAGTRLGRQELLGELLLDIEGALFTQQMLDDTRWTRADMPAALKRVCVSIDPAYTNEKHSDDTGIVVVGLTEDDQCVVLEDLSGKFTPEGWAQAAIAAYHKHQADVILGEVNRGGALVESNLRAVDRSIPFQQVTASRGKALRAEPVCALFEQNRAHILGVIPKLEDQLTSYVPGTGSSPDRLDAMVHAMTFLALGKRKPRPTISHFSAV